MKSKMLTMLCVLTVCTGGAFANMVVNGSFENPSPEGWTGGFNTYNMTQTYYDGPAIAGTGDIYGWAPQGDGATSGCGPSVQVIDLTGSEGVPFTFSAWLAGYSADYGFLRLTFNDAADGSGAAVGTPIEFNPYVGGDNPFPPLYWQGSANDDGLADMTVDHTQRNWSFFKTDGTVPAGALSAVLEWEGHNGGSIGSGSAGNDAYADDINFTLNLYSPSPEDGKTDVEPDKVLEWTGPHDPSISSVLGYTIYVDPNETLVADGESTLVDYFDDTIPATQTSYDPDPDLDYETLYYWRVVATVQYDDNAPGDVNEVSSPVWSFTVKQQDTPPVVDAGECVITTLELSNAPHAVALNGSVTDDGTSALTVGWQAYEIAIGGGLTTKVTFADAADPGTTVTISEAGTYILNLSATDATGTVSDQKEIVVIDDACQAAKATGTWAANYYDRNEDCVVDLSDFAVFALEWLNSTALSENFGYDAEIGNPSENALVAEYWTGLAGNDPNTMLDDPAYPDSPDGAYLVTGELRGALSANSYGQRIYGYLVPPTTGDYTFYIASDDTSRLFLSADTNPVDTDPALGNQIAEVTGYTNPDTWDTEPSQTSAPVSLTAGQYYYIEILHKEGAGGDHVSVGWSTDGGTTIEVIPGTALRYALP